MFFVIKERNITTLTHNNTIKRENNRVYDDTKHDTVLKERRMTK